MPVFSSVDDVIAAVGTELGVSDWLLVDQSRIDAFADTTEDRQWIHVDPDRAADGPYGVTIAHGYLTLSLIPRLSRDIVQLEGAQMAVNYGLGDVRFLAPVLVGSRLRARASLVDADPRPDGSVKVSIKTVVEMDGSPKPACVATNLVLYRFAAPTP